MVVAYLASDGSTAELAGRLMVAVGLPAIGVVCLVIGVVERSRSRRRAPQQPGSAYPAAPRGPAGYPGAAHPAYPAYPAAPPHPGYPPAVPPRPKASKAATTLITVGVVLVALGGLNILSDAARAVSRHGSSAISGHAPPAGSAAGPQIGACFSEFEVGIGKLNNPTDCAQPVATYELAARVGPSASCPDGKRDGSIYSRLSNGSATLCFAANFLQGHCYLRTDERTTTTWTPADCGEARYAKFSVQKRIDGSTDGTQCPPESQDIVYPVPRRVYCVVRSG